MKSKVGALGELWAEKKIKIGQENYQLSIFLPTIYGRPNDVGTNKTVSTHDLIVGVSTNSAWDKCSTGHFLLLKQTFYTIAITSVTTL